jgi:hypothetical protein
MAQATPPPITIKLPDGFITERILGSSDRDSWVLMAHPPVSLTRIAGAPSAATPPARLFEIDPETGDVIDQLNLVGTQASSVACAAHQKLTALYVLGNPDGAQHPDDDQLSYASAAR